jgi:Uma2 family endonuclease
MLDHMFGPRELAPQTIRGLSRNEYDRMVQLGMFGNERIELLRGALVTMSPQSVRHSRVTGWFARELVLALGRDWCVLSHSPYAAGEDSEPEPDISVSREGDPVADHPSNAVLIIEVSYSSILIDRRIKAPIYAEAGVPEYWIVNVTDDELSVEVHTGPTPDGYRHVKVLHENDVLRPTLLPGVELAVRDIPHR